MKARNSRRRPPGRHAPLSFFPGGTAVPAAALLAFLLPFLLYGAGLLVTELYDKGVLFLYYRAILPALPFLWAGAAVVLVYSLDKNGSLALGVAAASTGFSAGVFLLQDWWYFLPVTCALALPFFLWYGRRAFWNRDPVSTAAVVGLSGSVALCAAFSGFGRDERFGVAAGALPPESLVAGFLLALAVALVFWAGAFGLRQRRRRRALIAKLVERFPRCDVYFDQSLAATKRACGETRIERLAPAVERAAFPEAGPLWPAPVVAPTPPGHRLAFDLPSRVARLPGVRKAAILFRPALASARLNSSFFLATLDQACERDRCAFWNSLVACAKPDPERSFAERRTVSLRLVQGDGPPEFKIDGETVIGRSPELEAPLPATEGLVSNRHCTLTPVEGGVEVRDHSTNGTFVNGVTLTGNSCVARDGHTVRIGTLDYRVSDETTKFEVEQAGTSQLEDLACQPESERQANHRRAEAHFARYLLLSEARAEALYYFGVNARNPLFDFPARVEESDFWRSRIDTLIAVVEEKVGAAEVPGPGLSPSANWTEVHRIYEDLWTKNLCLSFVTSGRQFPGLLGKPSGGPSSSAPDFRRLTASLLLLRAQVSQETAAAAAADLGLLLLLAGEEETAKRAASAIDDFLLRTIKRFQRGGENAIDERDWPGIATAALPYLLWTVARGDAIRGDRIYNVLGPVPGHHWGALGNAFSMAFGALADIDPSADWEDLDYRGRVQSFVLDAAAAFDKVECGESRPFLKLGFLVHALRQMPE